MLINLTHDVFIEGQIAKDVNKLLVLYIILSSLMTLVNTSQDNLSMLVVCLEGSLKTKQWSPFVK